MGFRGAGSSAACQAERARAGGIEPDPQGVFVAAQVDDFEKLKCEEDAKTPSRIGDVERDAVQRNAALLREPVEKRGGFGAVYKVRDHEDSTIHALLFASPVAVQMTGRAHVPLSLSIL